MRRNATLLGVLAIAGLIGINPPQAAAAPPASPAVSTSPSGEAVPIGDLGVWRQTFVDDFTVNAATGTWATDRSRTVVYSGDHGGKWVEYPDGWASTYTDGQPGYQPGKVLSVHDGMLDFTLQDVNGLPSGANPSPLVTGKSQYQTYGRYTARIKSDTIPNYHAAWLLWPVQDKNGGCAESDYPETDLANDFVTAFAHNATNCDDYSVQNEIDTRTRINDGHWHTYTQEWSPGLRAYYLDGTPIGTSTTNVWNHDERWQLQVEPLDNPNLHTTGHLLVDWVAAYAYDPAKTGKTAPAPADTTDEATKAKEAGSVHPGATCSRPGAHGTTDTGTPMTCTGSPTHWQSQ